MSEKAEEKDDRKGTEGRMFANPGSRVMTLMQGQYVNPKMNMHKNGHYTGVLNCINRTWSE